MEISRFLTPKWEGSGMPAARQLEWVEGVCVKFFFFLGVCIECCSS